ncbi:MAG: hypothetical protein J6Y57_05250, partial [Lachnospiraceae bacterium]|nr:hypothetical protein [Lachnospiraceae bacterium]
MAYQSISAAKNAKNDEFYTQLVDIQAELKNYSDKFENKVVFCNCDDPFESNFVKYFLMNFNRFRLKELIATGYKTSSFAGKEVTASEYPYVLKVNSTSKYLVGTQKDLDIPGAKYFLETEGSKIMSPLIGNYAVDEEGNHIQIQIKTKVTDEKTGKERSKTVKQDLFYEAGDFRSDMSVELLKECDVVVTNPPFSLFREYVSLLMKYEKEFLIIGNINCISYKEVFPLIRDNKIWLGNGIGRKISGFIVPDYYELYGSEADINKKGERIVSTNNALWLTNLDHMKRHQMLPLDLGFVYEGHEDMYPKYDNYDAIEVTKTIQIPCDYKGIMGVPISFLDVFCPEQFEVVGISSQGNDDIRTHKDDYYDGYVWKCGKKKDKDHRISSWMPLLQTDSKGGTLCKKDGEPDLYQLYWRVFIRFTQQFIDSH